jgi:long-chain acyl-CoA synthetase
MQDTMHPSPSSRKRIDATTVSALNERIRNCKSFPAMLLINAERFPDRPAQRFKHLGIWQSWTWRDVLDEVRSFAAGLKDLGFQSGDRIAIVGRNRPRLYWSIAAAQSLGGVAIPIYHDSTAEEMEYVLGHAEATFAVVEDQEQVDKLFGIRDRLRALRHVVYDETRGMRDYDDAGLHQFQDVQARGVSALRADPSREAAWRSEIDVVSLDDLAVLLYTSGTTGRPKGVMLTYRNLITSALNANEFDSLDETDEAIAYLPMAWIGDHIFSYAQAYCAGYCVSCPESPETIAHDRHEIAPTYFFAPPRVFEEMLTSMLVRIEDAAPLKRRMFDYFIRVAKKWGDAISAGRPVPLKGRLLYAIGWLLVYRPIKSRLGFSRIKVAYTAGEAIGPDMFGFFRSLGVNLKQLYGQTEACVYIAMHRNDSVDFETVGVPAPEVEIRVTEQGEILFRSPGVFIGYHKEPEKTQEILTADGWVRTGDAGFVDDRGHLRIIDRVRDVGRLRSGELFAPKYVENKLKFFPVIKEAVAFGDGRDYCTAMINIELSAITNWAERNGISWGSYQELAAHPLVYDLVATHVIDVNRALAADPRMSGAQIRRFLILHKEFDADDGELTRTQKVRRNIIVDRYAVLIDALYQGPGTYEIETPIMFEDGRQGTVAGKVRVRDAETFAASGGRPSHARAA